MKYRILIPPSVAETIRGLAPNLKKKIKFALSEIAADPYLGKVLRDDLEGLRSYRVQRYRIVYRMIQHRMEIQIIDVGPHSTIYERLEKIFKK